MGQGRVEHVPLIPAHAGIQSNKRRSSQPWVPAFAGTSGEWNFKFTTLATNRNASYIEMFAALMIGPHFFSSLAM
jgi:hypothetical protein